MDSTQEIHQYVDRQIMEAIRVPENIIRPPKPGAIVCRTPAVPEDDDLFIVIEHTPGGWIRARPLFDNGYTASRRPERWGLVVPATEVQKSCEGAAEAFEALGIAAARAGESFREAARTAEKW